MSYLHGVEIWNGFWYTCKLVDPTVQLVLTQLFRAYCPVIQPLWQYAHVGVDVGDQSRTEEPAIYFTDRKQAWEDVTPPFPQCTQENGAALPKNLVADGLTVLMLHVSIMERKPALLRLFFGC